MRKQILPSPRETERPRTGRLLLVEDDPALALMLSWELEDRGIAVSLACTCADARDLSKALAFDAALVDVDLPDGDGVALAQTLAQRHPRASVAIYTGHHGIAERLARSDRPSECPVLTKPVALSHLLRVLGLCSMEPPARGASADFSLATTQVCI